MHNSNSFDHLIQKALQTNNIPPIPAALLQKWQPVRSEKGAKWIWILPSLVFILGIGLGVELAPLGLSNAFSAIKNTLQNVWQSIPEDALKWAFALLLGVVAFSVDSMKGMFNRLK